jgi:hypothetical protein
LFPPNPAFSEPVIVSPKRKIRRKYKNIENKKTDKKSYDNFLDQFSQVRISIDSATQHNVGQPYQPTLFPKNPVNTGIFRIKDNNKFVHQFKEKTQCFVVPYIDFSGCITNSILGVWSTTPSAFLCSLTSTIYDRLRKKYEDVYNRHRWKDNFLFRVAALYAMTNNSYIFHRILATLKKSIKNARKVMYYYFKKHMGKQFRFCYDQMFLNVQWLKSRGPLRPTKKLPVMKVLFLDRLITGLEGKKKDIKKLENFSFAAMKYRADEEDSFINALLAQGLRGGSVFIRYPMSINRI